jgi:hypothetical protein
MRDPAAAGVGEIVASRAVTSLYQPNPNKGLERFLATPAGSGATPAFDSMSWASSAKSSMSWNSMSWADQSWSDMSWADQSWATMSWADQSWSDMSWADMSWADMSSSDMSSEDAAEGDAASGTDGYVVTPTELADAANDPDLAVSVDPGLPAATVTVPVPSALLP